ncbi:MAG: prepilin peptidase, partial [Tardiphaga sp.]|nr:prepilin peptidase [Tardiphaga sp.]
LALISPAGIGMGDVKLSALLGLALGYLGFFPRLIGGTAGFVVGGLVSLIALLARRVTLRSSIPFGPAMLVGAFVGLLLS